MGSNIQNNWPHPLKYIFWFSLMYSEKNVMLFTVKISHILQLCSLLKADLTRCCFRGVSAGFPTSSTRASSSTWRCRRTSTTAVSGTSETQPSSHGSSWWVPNTSTYPIKNSYLINIQHLNWSGLIVFPALPGNPEPHAGLPQHPGLPRLDRLRHRLQPAAEEGAGLGLALHFGSQQRQPQPRGGNYPALPEPRPGGQEEHGGQRAAPLRRHQCPLRR